MIFNGYGKRMSRSEEKKDFVQYIKTSLFFIIFFFIFSVPVFSKETGRVTKVYDGDTVLLSDGRKVRYLGINTPEWQEPFYLKAKKLNESLVLGKEVRLEFDEQRMDVYGRLLAYVYVGEQMVNARLVEEGLAHAFFIPPNRKHNNMLLGLQKDAMQRRAGFWSKPDNRSVLKITTVRPAGPPGEELTNAYLRIVNISSTTINLAGYSISGKSGASYRFPDIDLQPGHTILVVSGRGRDGVNSKGQLIAYWKDQSAVWNKSEDTAYLKAPDGTLIDTFHYKGSRVSRNHRR
jgi:endonuclease YncB( thermonuclease family)